MARGEGVRGDIVRGEQVSGELVKGELDSEVKLPVSSTVFLIS